MLQVCSNITISPKVTNCFVTFFSGFMERFPNISKFETTEFLIYLLSVSFEADCFMLDEYINKLPPPQCYIKACHWLEYLIIVIDGPYH